jgi:hypothetical protein
MVLVPKAGTKLGDKTPVMAFSTVEFAAANVPPMGVTITEYCVLLLHMAGIGLMTGGAGFMAVILKVLLCGQFATEAVTTTVYTTVLTVPAATVGDIMVDWKEPLLPGNQTVGDHE